MDVSQPFQSQMVAVIHRYRGSAFEDVSFSMNTSSHLQHIDNLLNLQTRICNQYVIMSLKRKSFIVGLKNLVCKKKQLQAAKPCLAQIHEERKKQRKRSSLSSLCSHIVPLPTIMEEDELQFYAGEFSRF